MKLRDYQQAAVDAVLKAWQTSRSCLIVLPTGCGKTVVFGEVIRRRLAEFGGHAIVLAHREELVAQAEEKVAAITGSSVDVEMGPREIPLMFDKPILPATVVSSVQTQVTGRMNKFDPSDFSTLVIDEAHHATTKSYRKCIEHYLANPSCRLLGVTATPDRADETALGIVFDTVACVYSVDQAIHDGWLVPVRQKMVTVGSLDFSRVSTTAGDFNQGELGEILEEERNLHGIASPTIEICGNRRAIIFATTVRQAERLAEIINRHAAEEVREEVRSTNDERRMKDGSFSDSAGQQNESDNTITHTSSLVLRTSPRTSSLVLRTSPRTLPGHGRADWICGRTPKVDRKAKLERFRAGDLQYIVNVGVLTEGFDDAGVEVVVMARPTKSRALYAQMAGRATRPAAEIAARLGEIAAETGEVRSTNDELRSKDGEVRSTNDELRMADGSSSDSAGQHNESDNTTTRTSSLVLRTSSDSAGQHNESDNTITRTSSLVLRTSPRTSSLVLRTSPDSLRRDLIAHSSKPSCLIVDFVGNSGRHKLVSAIDILGGRELDPDEEEAMRIVRKKCEEADVDGLDARDELAKAREEVKRRKIEDAKRRAFIKVTARYTTVSVDPFNVYDLAPMTVQDRCALDRHTPSFKQRRLCRETIGVDPDRLAYSEVKALIDAFFGRRERGLSTLRQTKYLRKHGVIVPMSFKEASATISRLMASRGTRG